MEEADLRPHRLDLYVASNDPEFERKATDIIGLYMNPPQHAEVSCVDEKTAIQAWTARIVDFRSCPDAPSGTSSNTTGTVRCRFGPLKPKTGEVIGKPVPRHTSEEFIQFLADHPQVEFHFTPTYSSRLNQVEIWFANCNAMFLDRGFMSVSDLSVKICRSIRLPAWKCRADEPSSPLGKRAF